MNPEPEPLLGPRILGYLQSRAHLECFREICHSADGAMRCEGRISRETMETAFRGCCQPIFLLMKHDFYITISSARSLSIAFGFVIMDERSVSRIHHIN